MPDVHALNKEEDIFGNIGGVIGDSLQIVSDENEIEGRAYRVFSPIRFLQKLPVDGVFKLIDFVIGNEYCPGHLFVALHERIETPAHHGLNQLRHSWYVDGGLRRGTMDQRRGPFRHIDHQIAHALEVAVDFDRGCQEPQVLRDRLMQGGQTHRNLINFDVQLIDSALYGPDFLGWRLSAFHEP